MQDDNIITVHISCSVIYINTEMMESADSVQSYTVCSEYTILNTNNVMYQAENPLWNLVINLKAERLCLWWLLSIWKNTMHVHMCVCVCVCVCVVDDVITLVMCMHVHVHVLQAFIAAKSMWLYTWSKIHCTCTCMCTERVYILNW